MWTFYLIAEAKSLEKLSLLSHSIPQHRLGFSGVPDRYRLYPLSKRLLRNIEEFSAWLDPSLNLKLSLLPLKVGGLVRGNTAVSGGNHRYSQFLRNQKHHQRLYLESLSLWHYRSPMDQSPGLHQKECLVFSLGHPPYRAHSTSYCYWFPLLLP